MGFSMPLKIRFVEVGRNKKSWETEVPEGDRALPAILKSVQKSGALMSRGIEVVADGAEGRIYAGARCVGRFEIS